MGQFRHHHIGKTRTMAFFLVAYVVLRSTLHVTFFAYQSFNIVNTPIILLFSKRWVLGLAAEDNINIFIQVALFSLSNIVKRTSLDTHICAPSPQLVIAVTIIQNLSVDQTLMKQYPVSKILCLQYVRLLRRYPCRIKYGPREHG